MENKYKYIKYSCRYVSISGADLLTYFWKTLIVHSATLVSMALLFISKLLEKWSVHCHFYYMTAKHNWEVINSHIPSNKWLVFKTRFWLLGLKKVKCNIKAENCWNLFERCGSIMWLGEIECRFS